MFNRKLTFFLGMVTNQGKAVNYHHAVKSVVDLFARHDVHGFSVNETLGYWEGVDERSLTISVYCNHTDAIARNAAAIASSLADQHSQDCVLYALEPATAALIGPHHVHTAPTPVAVPA